MFKKNEEGFTLIELLIVIVIIGILAGVMVSVIDPATQQNRAKDANVKSTLNKVALATQAYVSAYGSDPTDTAFIAALDNAAPFSGTCEQGNDYECLFSVTGNDLPEMCSGNYWGGVNAGEQCYYRYLGAIDSSNFVIQAKSFGIVDKVFVFDSTAGAIQHCDLAGANCVTP